MPAGSAGQEGPKNAGGKASAKPAAMGKGKVQGLTRPGSKISLPVPSASDSASAKQAESIASSKKSHESSAPSAQDRADDASEGQAMVGRKVRKLFKGAGFFDGEVTHYVAASDTYRVRSPHAPACNLMCTLH